MTNEYYIARAKCRREERQEIARVTHKARVFLRRVYAAVLMAGLGFAGLVALWELGKVIEWTAIFIAGIIELF